MRTGLKMSEKAANVYRQTLKDLQKAWRTIAHDHFKSLQKVWQLGSKNIKEVREAQDFCTHCIFTVLEAAVGKSAAFGKANFHVLHHWTPPVC